MNQIKQLMEIHWTLPFGNEGRGTKVYLWPFVMVTAVSILAPVINWVLF